MLRFEVFGQTSRIHYTRLKEYLRQNDQLSLLGITIVFLSQFVDREGIVQIFNFFSSLMVLSQQRGSIERVGVDEEILEKAEGEVKRLGKELQFINFALVDSLQYK